MPCFGQLICIKKDGSEGTAAFQVTKNEISVGSLASCDLRLAVPGVEQIHFTLLVHLNSSALLKNFSTNNPVEVNGKPILSNTLLQDGDKISILRRTFLWRSSSFEANKAARKSIATCVRSPGNVTNRKRRKSEPVPELVAVVSPVRRSINAQSPDFASTRRSPSLINSPAKTTEGVTESLSQNVTVRRKVNTRVSTESSKHWSRGGNLRKSILRTAATPQANKSVRFDRSVNEASPEHAIWNVPRTPANAGFDASEFSSSDSESLSLIDLTNLSSSDYSEDVSKLTEYLSTPGRSFKSEYSEPETSPQSSKVGVRFDESSARALLSPFNARKSSMRQPVTPYVRSATKPLISFETPTHSLEVSSLISFETPATASVRTNDTSLISFETPAEASSVSKMKSTTQREKTPFRPGSSARLKPTSVTKPGVSATPGQSNPARTKLLASPKLKVDANKMPNKLKPKQLDQTPRRSTQLIRLKKKPAPATPVLNLGEVFKTPGKQGISESLANAKRESKRQTPARLPVLNIGEETPGKCGIAKTPASMIPTPKVLSAHHNVLISSKEFSPAHHLSHLKSGKPQIGANLRNGMPIGKTRGTYFPVNYDKRAPKSVTPETKSKIPAKFIPKSMFTHKFTTPAKMNVGVSHNRSTTVNEEIAGEDKRNDSFEDSTPVQTVSGEASIAKTPETTRVTRRSVAMPDNVSKTPAATPRKLGTPAVNKSVSSPAINRRSNAKSPKNITVTEIDIVTPEKDITSDTSAAETDSNYSPGQTIADLDFTNDPSVPPQNLSVLQNSDILLNMSTNSRVTRTSIRTFEESRLLNSTTDATPTSLQKLGTSADNASASSPVINRSDVFKTPLKTPAKNTRSSTVKKTPVTLNASRRSKTLVAQSTPNANEEGLSVSLAFSDVCETPSKTPVGTTVNNATITMSGSMDGTLKTQTKSNARSLRSISTVTDATTMVSASGFDATYELVDSPEEWHDLSPAEKSAARVSARKSGNKSTFNVSSRSPANISSRMSRNSTARKPRELYSQLSDENDENTFVTHLSGTSLENSHSRTTRNSTFNVSKTLPTPSTRTSRSSKHSLSNGVLQTSNSIRSSKTELDYDESVLNVVKPPSKSPIKTLRSSSIHDMSLASRSNLDVSSKGTECETSARKTRSRSNLSGVKFLNETYSPEKSSLTPGITRKSYTNRQIMQSSFEDSDESEVETSAEMTGNKTYLQSDNEGITRLSTHHIKSKTPSKSRVENPNSVVGDLPESPTLDLDEVFKTPLKSLASKPKTPAKIKQNEPMSPMLNLGDLFKTPSKTPAKMMRYSTSSVSNVSTKTPVNVNSGAMEENCEDSILPASNSRIFKKIPTHFTYNAVSPCIATKAGDLHKNANLYETELDYEESSLPSTANSKLQTPLKTLAKQAKNSSVINDTPLKTPAKSISGKKSKSPTCMNVPEAESDVTEVISSATLANSSSCRLFNTSLGMKDVSVSPLLNLVDIFGTPVKTRPKTPVNRPKSSSSATQAFDFGKLISSALNTANDVENSSFSSPLKSAALYASLNRSAGSPLTEVKVFQMLNKSNNSKTPAKLNRSVTKENFNPVTSPKSRDNAVSPKKVLCECATKIGMLEPFSENLNSLSRLSNASSITFFEPSPPKRSSKSARKSYSVPEKSTSTPETSFTKVVAVELTALSADGGRLRSKVMKPNAVSPILLDKLFEKSRSKLLSPPGSDPQSSKIAEPCDTNTQIPATTFDFNIKTPKDVSPLHGDAKFSNNSDKKLTRKSSLKKRASNVSKSSKKRSSGSFSGRSSGSSSTFTVTKKRLSTGKVPKRKQKLRFHPDIPSTPEVEQTSSREFSDEEETVRARRSTRKSTPLPTRTTRRSNRCEDEIEEEVPKKTSKKPAKKSTNAPPSKPKRSVKANTETAGMEKPVVPTKRTKSSVESSDILEPQRRTRRTTVAKPEVESKVVKNTSLAGKKRRSIQTQAAKTGAKRRKAPTIETEEIDSVVPRQRRTRVAAEKPETGGKFATKQEEPAQKNGRQMRQRNNDAETEGNAGAIRRKTKSTMDEIHGNEQVEQSSSRRKTRSNAEDEGNRVKGTVATTAEKIVPTAGKRNTRAAAKTTDKPKNDVKTAEKPASTQRKTRSRVTTKEAASKEVSPVKKTRSKSSQKSISQQTEEEALPSRRRTAKAASETATKRVALKKVQTPSPVPKKKTRSTNPVAGTSKENQENVSPQRKTRLNVKSQKRVIVGKPGRASLGRRVTRSRK